LVDYAVLDWHPHPRPRPARRRGIWPRRSRRLAPEGRRLSPGVARREPGERQPLAARAARQRCGPVARPRLSGASGRAGPPRCALHEMGREHALHPRVIARRFRYEYGAGPLHLVAIAASFSLAGWGLVEIFG